MCEGKKVLSKPKDVGIFALALQKAFEQDLNSAVAEVLITIGIKSLVW